MRSSVRLVILAVVVLLAIGTYLWWSQPPQTVSEKKKLPGEKVVLYLLNERTYELEAVRRKVPEATDHAERIKQIIQQLTQSPETKNLVRLVPAVLKLRSSYVDGQTIYLDFSDDLVGTARGTSGEMMLLYSIVNSVLKNLPEKYKLVHFLIEGEMRKTIGPRGEESGHIAIQYPLGPRWNLTSDTS